MKKIISILLMLAMVAAMFCGCTGNNDSDNSSDTIKIGIFEPASGSNGAGGKQESLGVKYANYVTPTVDIDGKTYNIELVSVDNASSNDKAPTAAAELVNAGVSVVLGSYGSGVSIAASSVFQQAGIPAIGITCTNPQVTEGNEHYFRICFLDPFQGKVLANYAFNELGYRKAYTLAESGNDYDEGLAYYFTEAFKALGGSVENANFPENTADFNSYITNAANSGAEVIFAPTSTNYAQLIIEQVAAKNINATLMAGDTWDSNLVLAAAKGKNVKIDITTFYQEGGNPEFDADFKAWLESDQQNITDNGGNSIVAANPVMGYDAYNVAVEAIKIAKSADPKAIMNALKEVDYTGVTGRIVFNETGDADRTSAYIKSANTETGLWDFVKEQGV